MDMKPIISTEDVDDAIGFIIDQLDNGYIDFSKADGDYRCKMAVDLIQDAMTLYRKTYQSHQMVGRLINTTGEYSIATKKRTVKVEPREEEEENG